MRIALRRMVVLMAWMAGTAAGWTATAPIYINNAPVQAPPAVAPQIDATTFVNRSLFSVSIGGFSIDNPGLPYETLSTLFFTNTGSGIMIGDPGFRFNFSTNSERLTMDTWVNQGRISTESQFFGFFSGQTANWLLVDATNISSSGLLTVGSQGLLRLEGKNINLRRSGLRSGNAVTNNGFFFGSSVLDTLYVNDVGISDLYWGNGQNNILGDDGPPMELTGFSGNALDYALPFPSSPVHESLEVSQFSGFVFTNRTSVPFFFRGGYGASVFTNQIGPTNFVVQVVFHPTNNFSDTNFSYSVRFYNDFGDDGATAVVGFHSVDFDVVNQAFFTNSVYLTDALAFETNLFFARNFDSNTRRPNTYEVTRNEPFYHAFGSPANATYTNTLIYDPLTFATNQVDVDYAAYSVQITPFNSPLFDPFGTVDTSSRSNPTNFPGRVEIIGDTVDLEKARVRADTTFILRAQNLVGNQLATVDAPFVILDIGSQQPSLVISNVAPDAVRRLNGTISAWSATWRNYEYDLSSTNAINTNLLSRTIDYHVLMVDDTLESFVPVNVNEFRVRGQNVIIADDIQVGSIFNLNMSGLELIEDLTLPFGAGWASTNVQNLVNFTNHGALFMNGSLNLGADRSQPYSNVVNSGSISAASAFVRTHNLDNSGRLLSQGGLLSVQALRTTLLGQPTVVFTNIFTNIFFIFPDSFFTNIFTNIVTNSIGATLAGNSDVQLELAELVVSNSIIRAGVSAPGTLSLNVTNRLVDAGPQAVNEWSATAGFLVPNLPPIADLQGTTLRSIADPFSETFHTWPARDLGPTQEGFRNNLALGRLVLDAQGGLSLLRFQGAGSGPRGLYVDWLEFENYATNVLNALLVDSDLTIYFADSNLSAEKLDGALGGRLRWVPYYTGPYSSTNLLYSSGATVTLNRALVTSKDRDDDNDGIVNAEDPEPVLVPAISISLTNMPDPATVLAWDSVAFKTNRVLMKTSLQAVAWQDLTSIVNGPVNSTLKFQDPLPPGTRQRWYQIRVE